MRLLVAIADRPFREELHNFLLSAGFDDVVLAGETRELAPAVERQSFDAVIVGGSQSDVDAATVRRLSLAAPGIPIVVLIEPDDRAKWAVASTGENRVVCLLKDSFTRNLLSLLREGSER